MGNRVPTVFSAKEVAAKDIDLMRNPREVEDRNEQAHHKADMELIRSSKKHVSVDDVLKIQARLAKDQSLLSRFNRYNRWVDEQQRKERLFKSIDEVKKEVSPFLPRAILEAAYNLDSLSLVGIQIDKIIAFSSAQTPAGSSSVEMGSPNGTQENPFQVLHRDNFDQKMTKLELAVLMNDRFEDSLKLGAITTSAVYCSFFMFIFYRPQRTWLNCLIMGLSAGIYCYRSNQSWRWSHFKHRKVIGLDKDLSIFEDQVLNVMHQVRASNHIIQKYDEDSLERLQGKGNRL